MEDFLAIFAGLDAHGPGTDDDRAAALAHVPHPPRRVLDLACGPGNATLFLLGRTEAAVTAVDLLPASLARLETRVAERGLADRVTTLEARMEDLPFRPGSFDLVWCENSVYAVGFVDALRAWRPLLTADGVLVVSDLVWLTDTPAPEVAAFWADEYPDMAPLAARRAAIQDLGWDLLGTHTLDGAGWAAYHEPLAARLDALPETPAHALLRAEIAVLERQSQGHFSYVYFVLRDARR
jgi:SAM-dependent methyltransferase